MRGTEVLDFVAAVFACLLRRAGASASPAEMIEVRRVLLLLGASDRDALRAALRATCVKFGREQRGFDRAFDALFGEASNPCPPDTEAGPSRAHSGSGLPDQLALDDDEQIGRYAEYNERAAEVGDHFDSPEAAKGFNPHKDDDDISVSGADSELSVSADADAGRRGVRYTVEVDRAATTDIGELADALGPVVAGALHWEDPASILAWLDAYDPDRTYGGLGDGEPLTAEQLARLSQAVEDFVAALSERCGLTANPEVADATEAGPTADVDLACHEVLRRMRGAPRVRPRSSAAGAWTCAAPPEPACAPTGCRFTWCCVIRCPIGCACWSSRTFRSRCGRSPRSRCGWRRPCTAAPSGAP